MSRSRVVAVVVLLLCVGLVAALFFPMPRSVTRGVAAMASTWLTTGPLEQDGRLKAMSKRLLGAYVHMSLAAQLAEQVDDAASEEELLLRIVLRVRDKVLTQWEFQHIARSWPVLVAGVGYCDQVNGAVAMIAAQHFEKAQLYALYDPVTKSSPHSLGRVWSSTRREWIYFDAFYDVPVIYTRAADRSVHFYDIPPQPRREDRGAPKSPIYHLDGWPLADMKSNFAAYVLARSPFGGDSSDPSPDPLPGSAAPSAPPDLVAPVLDAKLAQNPPVPPTVNVDEAAFDRVSRAFVLARMDDLLGESPVEAYQRIASDPAAARDDRVAMLSALADQLAADAVR